MAIAASVVSLAVEAQTLCESAHPSKRVLRAFSSGMSALRPVLRGLGSGAGDSDEARSVLLGLRTELESIRDVCRDAHQISRPVYYIRGREIGKELTDWMRRMHSAVTSIRFIDSDTMGRTVAKFCNDWLVLKLALAKEEHREWEDGRLIRILEERICDNSDPLTIDAIESLAEMTSQEELVGALEELIFAERLALQDKCDGNATIANFFTRSSNTVASASNNTVQNETTRLGQLIEALEAVKKVVYEPLFTPTSQQAPRFCFRSRSQPPNSDWLHILADTPSISYTIQQVERNSPTHVDVEISGEDMGPFMSPLAESLKKNTTVRRLTLKSCKIGSNTGSIALILQTNRTLYHLSLEDNGIGLEGTKIVSSALKTNKTLIGIWLGSNNICAEGARFLADMIKTNSILQVLGLVNNHISDNGATALASALRTDHSLTILSLRYNEITDEGMLSLSSALETNVSLLKLYLDGNCIGDKGAQALSSALRVNSTLQGIWLVRNFVNEEGAESLQRGLLANHSLKKLDLERNSVSRESIRLINHLLDLNLMGPDDAARQKAATFVSEMRGDEEVRQEEDSVISKDRKVMERLLANPIVCDPVSVSLKYLKHCTNDFSNERLLGTGSCSRVYLGKEDSLRKKFAVKLLRDKFLAGVDVAAVKNTFQREIETLKHFRHPNICRLFAYSSSKDLRCSQCLVFEYASNGSLFSFLSQKSKREKLHWTTRINIALDVAKALEYLHKGLSGQICYHRDVKSANICLRRNYKALLVDCGLSKLVPEDESNATLTIMESREDGLRGTRGYICPVYARLMRGYTSESEVFSLGIVMIELFTGKIQNSCVDGTDVDLFNLYSRDGAEGKNLQDCADTDAGEWDGGIMCEFSSLLVDCISMRPSKRPKIGDIVLLLGKLAARSRGWMPGERNSIKVLTSEPLVWCDDANVLHPISASLNFKLERELIVHCIKETKRNIEVTFDIANDDRIMSAASRRHGCLHFSGHGHENYLLFEDERGGAHFLGAKELYDSVHEQPFKFVFVSACSSEFMGKALVQAGVPHVVCCKHDEALNDDAALKFTQNFYLALIDGYTIQAAFKKGRQAVSKRFDDTEVDKFVLLPRNGEHNIQLFDAEVLEMEKEILGNEHEPFIPVPPKPFIGREVDMYCLLQKVISERFVTLIGTKGVGCSSMASALSNYIRERKNVILDIQDVYFVRRKEVDAKSTMNTIAISLNEQLVSGGRAQKIEGDNQGDLLQNIIVALKGTSVLIVLDGFMEKHPMLIDILTSLFEQTNSVKVLLTAHSPIGISLPNVSEHEYILSPLSFENSVRLFSQLCPHTETPTKRSDLYEALVNGGCMVNKKGLECQKRMRFFSERLGSGNPSEIVRAAGEASREDVEHLARGQTG